MLAKGVRHHLVGGTDGPMSEYLGVALHVNVSNGSLDNWIANHGNDMSCHFEFYKDGSVTQYVDTANDSWCQMDGNRTYLSFESEGYPNEALTAKQVHAMARVYAQLHEAHGIPLQIANHVGEHGFGWHGMGGAAWGGHYDCPGDLRKHQRHRVLELAQHILDGTTSAAADPTTQEVADVARFVSSKRTHRVYFIQPGEAPVEINTRKNVPAIAEVYGISAHITPVDHDSLKVVATRFGGKKAGAGL